ncbi:MAG: RnfABCDGE type electron transport complex subunit D [Acidobacteriota bacterium]|nr:RnfABCDGE type electron transport complex subunit D [Acidobacteriota bacterium]
MSESSPALRVAPSPHLAQGSFTTRRMMIDVLIALAPVIAVALWVFRWYAVKQVGLSVLACLAFEALFTSWRGRRPTLGDASAAVTGLILGLSLPWSAPWYVSVIASMVAVGIGKIVFGGLGQNLFNPAMVGRAFVMICFPAALGAAAYTVAGAGLEVITQATPLTAAKQLGEATGFTALALGTANGSLGETSALACLIGGLYLCLRRTASWEIPLGTLASVGVIASIAWWIAPGALTHPLHHLLGGALLFGAFFIATDPVTSPLTGRGKLIFGAGLGALVMLIRLASGYPEGVMFAVLLMNAVVPLINRWTIPEPVGGPVPAR